MTRFYSSTAQPTTLSAAATDVATSIQVAATTGFPATEFILALDYGAAEQELVKVTAVAGTTLTVVRGFDSTAAQAHALGAAVRHVHSADDFRLSRTHEAASSGVHGATGALVGTTDAQALTNKDLTAGTNTFPASLATLSGVQALSNKNLSDPTNTFPGSLATDAELSAHAAATATHGVSGVIVGTTGSQTLTNKDLTSTTNTLPAYVTPVGEVKMFAGAAAPSGYLLCDGTAVSRATYPALFALIGSTYGAGDGTTTFNVPNLKGRVVVGRDAAQVEFDTLGETGGEKTHTLTTAEMPSHSHGGSTSVAGDHTHGVWKAATAGSQDGFTIQTANTQSSWGGVVQNAGNHSHAISAEGSGGAHNNLQPYIALNYIIRAA